MPHRLGPRRAAGAWLRWARIAERRLLLPTLDFLLPTSCFACAERLGLLQRLGACADCWTALRPLPPPLCPGCALPRPRGTDLLGPVRGRCAACLLDPGAGASAVTALLVYDDTARAFLLRAKFSRRAELLVPLGAMMAVALEISGFAADVDLIVPAPSHPWASLRRGFQPARELARAVARRLGLPIAGRCLRLSWRAPLSGRRLTPASRRRRAAQAIAVRTAVRGRRVLLIDDVMTTGATVGACSAALLRAGAVEVRAAVWARALPAGWRVV